MRLAAGEQRCRVLGFDFQNAIKEFDGCLGIPLGIGQFSRLKHPHFIGFARGPNGGSDG
jgi:hypothetical protein